MTTDSTPPILQDHENVLKRLHRLLYDFSDGMSQSMVKHSRNSKDVLSLFLQENWSKLDHSIMVKFGFSAPSMVHDDQEAWRRAIYSQGMELLYPFLIQSLHPELTLGLLEDEFKKSKEADFPTLSQKYGSQEQQTYHQLANAKAFVDLVEQMAAGKFKPNIQATHQWRRDRTSYKATYHLDPLSNQQWFENMHHCLITTLSEEQVHRCFLKHHQQLMAWVRQVDFSIQQSILVENLPETPCVEPMSFERVGEGRGHEVAPLPSDGVKRVGKSP